MPVISGSYDSLSSVTITSAAASGSASESGIKTSTLVARFEHNGIQSPGVAGVQKWKKD